MAESVSIWSMRTPKTDSVGRVYEYHMELACGPLLTADHAIMWSIELQIRISRRSYINTFGTSFGLVRPLSALSLLIHESPFGGVASTVDAKKSCFTPNVIDFVETSTLLKHRLCWNIDFVETSTLLKHRLCWNIDFVETSTLLKHRLWNNLVGLHEMVQQTTTGRDIHEMACTFIRSFIMMLVVTYGNTSSSAMSVLVRWFAYNLTFVFLTYTRDYISFSISPGPTNNVTIEYLLHQLLHLQITLIISMISTALEEWSQPQYPAWAIHGLTRQPYEIFVFVGSHIDTPVAPSNVKMPLYVKR